MINVSIGNLNNVQPQKLLTSSQCLEIMHESQFLFQNTEILISLGFMLLLSGVWLISYYYADDLANRFSHAKIQNFLVSIQYAAFVFCTLMIFYILYFK